MGQFGITKVLFDRLIDTLHENGNIKLEKCELQKAFLQEQQRECNENDVARKTKERLAAANLTGRLISLFPGSKYYISTDDLSWHLAGKFCKSVGMELASVESEEENTAIYHAIVNTTNESYKGERTVHYWTSGTDLDSEGHFYWSATGEDIGALFTLFAENQPDNADGKENCLQLCNESDTFRWHDEDCSTKLKFICELN
ncbi:lectin subunit alpha-like [Cloeon dipterum]|uniref:lectin subunit alpha-like n=1 Tax=Cloeon dipterum TaxID=197152 RepID=UPI00322093B4